MRHILTNVMIFDGNGTPSRLGEVVVVGERITAVSECGAHKPQPGDKVFDGRGRTLMPGLVEAHAHLSWPSSVEKIYREFVLPPDEMKKSTWRNARVLLDHGFTSAYSAVALSEYIEVSLR